MALKITVIGTGYLGATHAAAMAELGFEVLGLDIVPEKIAMLSAGRVPMYEPGLEELLGRHVAGLEGSSGRLRFTTSWEEVGAFGDIHFVCVNTPQKHGEYACDMSFVDAAFSSLAPHLTGPALVVGKSTVPVGSAARLAGLLRELAPGEVELAWNPEFLREGFAVADTLHPDRIVVGVESERAERLLREVYAGPVAEGSPFVVTDFPTAELVKTAANSFLSTKISFINAMAEICEAAGGDVVKLAEAIGHDDRIGKKFLRAGIGFGGGCLPKDIRAFMARAGELGADQALTFLREVDSINMRRRTHMVELAREAVGGSFLGKRVAVLGAAFKPDSDDVRDSPALNVAGQIHLQGGQVTVYDPKGMANARVLFPTLGYADSAEAAARGADVVLHLTEWAEFRELDPAELGEVVADRIILDGRNALDGAAWRKAGWTYRAMGRPTA
ncbi:MULTISPECIES: UDP-glucose dehydrogenase family protein [Streptomyces]|uniref:UDP-glucose 6-dehydrogenase n=1 Tax=Streptomyces tsukubensis (strain DSM 42081 / NBRC 108919 / NRRL 18488 / 9993) TaxID=1114943 RepID=I2MZ87_STRT9|nr:MULTISPECIES: UDP-glucose/GDP-mannose dehydrogenase family protein [Streptomyces]AZK94355.1 UDP-glucose 6-dehydrogenase [Streptomyces tsukubensis]EIF90084.1 UDP-glucose 6-dehydrogenase [Streptomyces tsukubensis NRRL18488]MYS64497.1 nucleotide sugar dehydrogenase [Streptomyces sp. SID5473]QKM69552.1 UDP-glucose/GDP-mannose dehydrogenase family protein [Streptomyces tsukubensis NRRL18488]TAI42519.1 UDP-glucose/GDP-mannose dehydrogenase family protein [Streptomyces tsukubensis]